MDPQQEIYTELLVKLRELPYDIYDGMLPPDDVPYPFVFLGENQQIDKRYKGIIGGTVLQTIHVFHSDVRSRGSLSKVLFEIKKTARNITHSSNYSWDVANVDQQILPDESTDIPLLHGVLDIEFQFT